MTVRDRIIEHLRNHPEGVDDDVLAEALILSCRQHANQECRKLESAGLVERKKVSGKTRNFLRDGGATLMGEAESRPIKHSLDIQRNPERAWDWEGNVQSAVVTFLVSKGFTIRRVANTLTKEQGKDLVAVASLGRELWVSAKGLPKGTPKTPTYVQAGHYFKDAFHDLLRWREEDKSVALALAFPDFVTYRNNARKVAGQLQALQASIFWVFEDGKVEASPDWL